MLYNVSYDGTKIVPIKNNRQRLFDGTAPERCSSLSVADRISHWVFEPVVINKNTHNDVIEKQTMSRSWNSELQRVEEVYVTISKTNEAVERQLQTARSEKTKQLQEEAGKRIGWLFGESDKDKLQIKQLNALARISELQQKSLEDTELTQAEMDEIALMKVLNIRKDELRAIENTTTASLVTKDTIEEVKAVNPTYPEWSVDPNEEEL